MEHPGLLYVAATLLPLASFVLLLLAGGLRTAARSLRDTSLGASLYRALGEDRPIRAGGYIATGSIGLAFVLSLIGFVLFQQDHGDGHAHAAALKATSHEATPTADKWADHIEWAKLPELGSRPGTVLTLGYRIDSLTAVMFLMVSFVATLIHLFSIGYMSEELQPIVEDHQVHTDHGHLRRRGRFGRFFLFMSLFCFSMLNLVLADNLFQVFLSWELVGICSYLLIGFYHERRSASNAANKAFITNRIGDAGFIIGLLILWTYLGTFNFEEIFQRLEEGSMPHWLVVTAGLGVFLGCVGKSAQFPLQVWLPDAMEGPTPVSALIHAATMVAAGVYLVGRVYPLFTPEARLVIAYTGGITLFVAATIAIVMTDIKKVLAYSTVSQLGYMMLALGVGGRAAGLFHLLTHAFFKALLFLGSGSVIYGCHHEQDMLKMGGLRHKMKITAYTMLVGVLAIAGIPLFSGWYSKDAILAQALSFVSTHNQHFLLFLLPLVTAGITTFYMFRMWYLTFEGKPRDEHIYEHAQESTRVMTMPLIFLAFFSVVVGWGANPFDPEGSWLESQLHYLQSADASAWHFLAGNLALAIVLVAMVFATVVYYSRVLDPAEAKEQFPGLHRFLWNKWYFDELYSAILVRPGLAVAYWCRSFDLRVIDGFVDFLGRFTVGVSRWDGKFDLGIVDGLVNLTARVVHACGARLRTVQTGYIRSYVLFLVLAAIGIFFLLSYFMAPVSAG